MPKFSQRTYWGRGQHLHGFNPNSDPWYRIDEEFLTTLDDLGIIGRALFDYGEEVEDYETEAPLRRSINGRQDHTLPTPTYHHIAEEITYQEVSERDLISAYEVSRQTGADFTKLEETLNRSTDLPLIQGWVTINVTPRVRRALPYYDRIDLYDWLERHKRSDLVARMKRGRGRVIKVKKSSFDAATDKEY